MYIYCLIDPRTDKPFYVGQTKDTHTRLIRHLQESLRGKYPKDFRLTEIIKAALIPKIKILEEIDIQASLKKYETTTSEREKYWTEVLCKDNELDNMQNNPLCKLDENKKICLYCQKEYFGFSSKSRYCSTQCRVYYNREKKLDAILNDPENKLANKQLTKDLVLNNMAISKVEKSGEKIKIIRIDPNSKEGEKVQELATNPEFASEFEKELWEMEQKHLKPKNK